jgi:hypothetical protein
MRKKPSRATGKHQKEREGCRNKKHMVEEDQTGNGQERQEEEVKDRKTTIKHIGRVTVVLTLIREHM